MASLLSLNILIHFYLILFSFLPTAFAAGPRQGGEPPELPFEEPPVVIVHPNPVGSPQGSSAPFSEPESTEGPDLADLADKVKELIEDIISLFAPSTTSSSAPPLPTAAATITSDSISAAAAPSLTALSTSQTGTLNATLACEVYQAYTSLCPPVAATPYTSIFVGGMTIRVNAAEASDIADTARASCLCYSSAYWVPGVYDDAAWACAGYITDSRDHTSTDSTLAAAATAAAAVATQSQGFCASVGPVRVGASFATFGEFTAAATSTTTPTTTPAATASPGGSIGSAGRSSVVKREVWAQVAAVVMVAAMV
ncbi:hypothetical protein MMC17_006511 [Xylographa soralifera]|nr:hypothetical protein [Xylographa soralifera]